MNEESVKIILPLPPTILSPNRQAGSFRGRMAKAAASKKYRRLSKEAAEQEGIQSGPWERATIKATFYHKQKRRRESLGDAETSLRRDCRFWTAY
jgi:hypothetical protein